MLGFVVIVTLLSALMWNVGNAAHMNDYSDRTSRRIYILCGLTFCACVLFLLTP